MPNYNSRRKILKGINGDVNGNNISSSNKKETFDLNALNINTNSINNQEGVAFNSRRQHILNKIAV